MFVDFINRFRKTKHFKILGFISIALVPIMALISTQSLTTYSNGFFAIFTCILQGFWIFVLFPILLTILFILFFIFTLYAIDSVRNKNNNNYTSYNCIADIGYLLCLFYLVYCLFFYFIVPTSTSYIDKGIDYINKESQNFFNLSNANKDNSCIVSKNTLNCFAKNINGGIIDKNYEGYAILTFDRIYYFSPTFESDKTSDKLLLIHTDVYVSDRLKIVAPVEIAKIYNDYFYTKDKKIKLHNNKNK